jgi:hypothetical protein
VNRKLFEDISATITLKDRGFISVSATLSSWSVEMKDQVETACSISWILLYRASISNYQSADFHRASDGMGKCIVVVKADNKTLKPRQCPLDPGQCRSNLKKTDDILLGNTVFVH